VFSYSVERDIDALERSMLWWFLLLYDRVKADNSIVDYHKVTDF